MSTENNDVMEELNDFALEANDSSENQTGVLGIFPSKKT